MNHTREVGAVKMGQDAAKLKRPMGVL